MSPSPGMKQGVSGAGYPRLDALSPEVQDLLAGRALGDLSPADASAALDAARLYDAEADSIESAAGALYLALAQGSVERENDAAQGSAASTESPEPIPSDVLGRLYRLGDAFVAARHSPVGLAAIPASFPPILAMPGRPAGATNSGVGRGLWLALAASVVVAAGGWLLAGRQLLGGSPTPVQPYQIREQVAARSDAVTIPWSDWSDADVRAEVEGVTGEVVWSDQAQSGVMRLVGLPHIPGSVYQLWIIDAERGMSQRVSGAIFTAGDKETWVEIEPRIGISRAAAFAVTIEQPGGTWVSDMSRRVVIAARPV